MLTSWICLDVATAPIPDAGSYLEPVSAPPHYKDPVKIADYIYAEMVKRDERIATDLDLCRITAIGLASQADKPIVHPAKNDDQERFLLSHVATMIDGAQWSIITYGGLSFDLPVLMRRARYLGVDFPTLNLDRYRSPHPDLMQILSDRDPSRRRSLNFYVKRLGWEDLAEKPLSGAEEARVPESGRWDDLMASVRRDVEATVRLAKWMGVIA